MIPRHLRIAVLLLLAWALLIVFFLPGMRARLSRIAQFGTPRIEEQSRREVTRPVVPPASTGGTKAMLFWAAANGEGLEAVEVELPLSSDSAERARQLLDALVTRPPSEGRRTLPADAAVLEVYALEDGTGIVDFSASVGASLPSGVRSEQLAVDSILRTLAANVPALTRIKIMIQGQEADTLAGHVDLTGYFALQRAAAPEPTAPAKKDESATSEPTAKKND